MNQVRRILLVSLALAAAAVGSVRAQETAPQDGIESAALDIVPPGPPCALTVRDYLEHSDSGDKIEIEWGLSPDDGSGAGDVTGYVLSRSLAEGEVGDVLEEIASGATHYVDVSVEPGVEYYYSLEAYDGTNSSERVWAGPVAGRVNLFQWSRLSVLVLMLLFFAMVTWFTAAAGKGAKLFVRRIPGLNAIEEAVGRATEMGRPVLYVPGIGEIDNIMTIASLNILSHVAKITARYDTPLIVPTARAVVMSAAEEVVKQAYAEVGNPDAYNPDNIRYLSDAQFAFAGAVNGIMLREKPAANLYMGAFWAESLLLAETGFEAGAIQVAGTAMVSQLPFFVTACDFTLMGEELYAASAYLSREPKLLGGLKGSDWMKVVSIVLMVAGIVAHIVGLEWFVAWFQTQ
jgi:hypothetical protein